MSKFCVGRKIDGKKGEEGWRYKRENSIREDILKRLNTTSFGERMKKWVFSHMV